MGNLDNEGEGASGGFFSASWKLYREAYSGLPRQVWWLSFVLLVNRSGTMVLPFMVIFLKFQRGYTPTDAGWLMSIYGVGAIIGSLLGGWLSVRVGAFRTQIFSLLVSGPLFALLGFLTDWWALATCLFTLSVVGEAVRPASVAATTELCPEPLHKKAFALNRLAVNLGMTLGPAIGGFLYMIDYHLLFVIDGISCCGAGLLVWGLFGLGGEIRSKEEHRRELSSARPPWRDAPYLVYMLALISVSMVFFQVLSTYPLYLKEHYLFAEQQIGMLLAINTVIIVAVEMVFVHALRRFDELVLVACGVFFTCLGFGVTPFGSGWLICIIGIVLWTIGEMFSMPFSLAFVSRRASSAYRGMYLGFYTTSYSVAFVLAPLVGTTLYEIDRRLPWVLCLALAIPLTAAMLAIAVWVKREEDRKRLASESERERTRDLVEGAPVDQQSPQRPKHLDFDGDRAENREMLSS